MCFLIYPGVDPFDVAGPTRAFSAAGLERYKIVLSSVSGGLIQSDSPGVAFQSVNVASIMDPIDTLIITGGRYATSVVNDPVLIDWVKRLAKRASRVACVCTGAFLAAASGLLTGRRAVTHWQHCDELERRFRTVKVERDPIWIKDDRIWTCAGVSASLDLALALIEEDQGAEVALSAARELVVFFKRPGGQSQFSTLLLGQIAGAGGRIQTLLAWMADNVGSDLRPQILADRAGMSLRTFARTCVAHTGMTPAKLIERLRVQAAREAVEQGDVSFETLAVRYGFGDEQRMRRAFIRQVRATPTEMRSRFGR